MIVRYDSLNRLETPVLILCNPGSVQKNDGSITNVIGTIVDSEAEEAVLNFNAVSELNFRVNRVRRDNPTEDSIALNIYKSIKNRRLIFAKDIGYFMITSVKDGLSDGIQYKDITAQSADVEIQQKMVPYIENNTYKFWKDETEEDDGLIQKIVKPIPLWKIGHIDDAVAERYRTFEDVDTSLNCLSFMIENMQDAYECIFIFDTINRIINVYDQSSYVKETSIHLTKDDLIDTIDITENADDLYTAISVFGDSDDVTISAINPLGSNTIYNFNYYLEWMSEGLREKVKAWQKSVEEARPDYYTLNESYYTKLEEQNNINFEIQKLEIQISMYIKCRNNIVAESSTEKLAEYNKVIAEAGGTEIKKEDGSLYQDIEETKAKIDELIAECQSKLDNEEVKKNNLQEELNALKQQIEDKQNTLLISKAFSDDELEELNLYIYEGDFKDEYVTITEDMDYSKKFSQMKTLYDRAESQLQKVSVPTQEFSIDVENFLFIKEFEHMSNQLETGCLINVAIDDNDVAQLFLSNITVNYDDRSMSMTFGNRFNKFDPKSLFNDMLGNISKSANTLDFVKDVIKPISNGEFDYMKEAIQTSRNLTMQAALSSGDEEVTIDATGYTGKHRNADGSYEPLQVKIVGKNIVFTDDAWETCKTAIGQIILSDGSITYGINAETIIGDLLMGSSLRILAKDEYGNTKDLLSVVDGKIETSISDINGNISEIKQTADGINLIVKQISKQNEDGSYSVDVDQVTTTTGYKFNADGLTIQKSGDEMKNLLDNTGMYVTRSGEEVLTANNKGVNAINLHARQYLIIGKNSRLEDYSNGTDTKRTACFYIGNQNEGVDE